MCVSSLEFNVPFQHKYGYIRDDCNVCFSADEETSNVALLGKQMTAERPQIPSSMFDGMLVLLVAECNV